MTIPKDVIGLTGFAQSGKDSAAAFLVEDLGYVKLSFADILRTSLYNLNPIIFDLTHSENFAHPEDNHEWRVQEIVDSIGWDAAKVTYPEIRQLLQRFGTDVGRNLYGENFWVDRITSQFEPAGKYVISDVRFPNEEAAVHNHGGLVLRINRPGVGAVNAHISDTGIDSLHVDGVVLNDGDIEQFRKSVLNAVGIIA